MFKLRRLLFQTVSMTPFILTSFTVAADPMCIQGFPETYKYCCKDYDPPALKKHCAQKKETTASKQKPTPPRTPKPEEGTSKAPRSYKTQDCAALMGFRAIESANLDLRSDEYAFYIVMRVEEKERRFFYTEAVNIGTGGGGTPLPRDQGVVRGFAHTHPSRIAFQGFSAGDKDEFLKSGKPNERTWYLRSPLGGLKKATSEEDFPYGADLPSHSCVE